MMIIGLIDLFQNVFHKLNSIKGPNQKIFEENKNTPMLILFRNIQGF